MHIVVDRRPARPRPPASTGLAPWTWTMLDLSRHEIWIGCQNGDGKFIPGQGSTTRQAPQAGIQQTEFQNEPMVFVPDHVGLGGGVTPDAHSG